MEILDLTALLDQLETLDPMEILDLTALLDQLETLDPTEILDLTEAQVQILLEQQVKQFDMTVQPGLLIQRYTTTEIT